MLKIKKIFVFLFIGLVSVAGFYAYKTSADTKTASDSGFTYLFHLYFSNNQLVADRDVKFQYDIVAEPYLVPVLKTANPYHGEIVNFQNKILATFQFDTSIVKGRFSVKGPYFADGDNVNFYDSNNQLLLTLSVSASSFCNDDNICNSDVGENSDNCPTDCHLKPPPSTSVTPQLAAKSGSNWLGAILYLLGGIAIVIVIWLVRRSVTKKNIGPSNPLPPLPPQIKLP
jgi:hypothetical protein